MATATFYFDIGSPYSYFAFEILNRYEKMWNVSIKLKQIVLGAVFKAARNSSPVSVPAKARYGRLDLRRNSLFCKVPFRGLPENFGTKSWDTRPALFLVIAALQQGAAASQVSELVATLFRCAFAAEGKGPVTFDSATLETACVRAGFSSDAVSELVAAAEGSDCRDTLQANTDEALGLGAFGAPFLVVHSDQLAAAESVFFGSDRFEQIAFLLGKPWWGPWPAAVSKL